MPHPRASILVGAMTGLSLLAPAAWGQQRLVADLTTTPISSRPFPLLKLNGRVLFGADSVAVGRELWSTDGTAAGTTLVKDVRPGGFSGLSLYTDDGALSLFVVFGPENGGVVLFAADDGVHGTELWATNGTADGTAMVKDINPGPGSSWPRNMFFDGGVLYFTADDGVRGLEPWRTDGTEAGTTIVADVVAGAGSSRARVIGVDALGYYLTSLNPAGIWKKNFALPSAVVLHANPVEDGQAIVHNGELLFRGEASATGAELWKSTGTPPGTALLSDLQSGASSSFPMAFTAYNGQVYFRAAGFGGSTLFRTNGTAAGTSGVTGVWNTRVQTVLGTFGNRLMLQVADVSGRSPNVYLTDTTGTGTTILTGAGLTRPLGAGPYNGYAPAVLPDGEQLYLLGTAPNAPTLTWPQVFVYPGTGTAVQAATRSTTGPAAVQTFAVLDGRVVMAAEDTAGENELWAADGPGSMTSTRIADVHTGNAGSSLAWLRAAGNRLMFLSRASSIPGRLGITEGTPASTRVFADVAPDAVEETAGVGPTVLGSTLYFENRTLATGLELWASDGTPETTRLVRDISPGNDDTEFDQLTASGSFVYFRVISEQGGTSLWRTDGTSSPTGTIALTPPTWAFSNLTDVAGQVMFVGRNSPSDPPGLWMSDGTVEGTQQVRAFNSLSIGGTPITAVTGTGRTGAGAVAFFASGPLSAEGRELWMSDASVAGAELVADIVPGPGSSNPTQIVSAGVGGADEPRVFFVAATTGEGAELWFSDGTEPGTRRIKDIRIGSAGSEIAELSAVVSEANGAPLRAFFIADDGAGPSGGEARLWTSDGTELGTHAVMDINPGGDDRVGHLTIDHRRGRVYFTADDGLHGLELWVSDGTAAGTRLAADVWPGNRSGLEIAEPGNPSSRPSLTLVNSRLYFIGHDGAHGNELRVLDLCPADFSNDGDVSVQDIFDFLAAFFTQDDRADVNGSGGVTVQDVFDYLVGYFGGCG